MCGVKYVKLLQNKTFTIIVRTLWIWTNCTGQTGLCCSQSFWPHPISSRGFPGLCYCVSRSDLPVFQSVVTIIIQASCELIHFACFVDQVAEQRTVRWGNHAQNKTTTTFAQLVTANIKYECNVFLYSSWKSMSSLKSLCFLAGSWIKLMSCINCFQVK